MNRVYKTLIAAFAVVGIVATAALASPVVIAFTDHEGIAEGHQESVDWASQHRIVQGYDDGSFRPGVAVSRQQAASLLHRYHATSTTSVESQATPVPAGEITTVESRCPQTMVARAGGYQISEPVSAVQAARVSVLRDQPIEGGGVDELGYSAWEVRVANASTDDVTVQVSVLCALR